MNPLRGWLKRTLLGMANVKRLHIVGCARSGTTMLHYSMVAFENIVLFDRETDVWNSPSVTESLKLSFKYLPQKKPCYYVTKRSYGWWKEDKLNRLASEVLRDNIFLINIVRDPRDVLTSTHKTTDRKNYVEPQRWFDSVQSDRRLMEKLNGYPYVVTIRYEDVVSQPQSVCQQLQEKFSLTLNPKLEDWSRLKDNMEVLEVKGSRTAAMHKLRNFDPDTIGKWKEDQEKVTYINELLEHPEYGKELVLFMEEHGYE